MSEVMIDPNVLNLSVAWSPTSRLRQAVPSGTYAGPPVIQQLWIERFSGQQQWRAIERVVLSSTEFYATT